MVHFENKLLKYLWKRLQLFCIDFASFHLIFSSNLYTVIGHVWKRFYVVFFYAHAATPGSRFFDVTCPVQQREKYTFHMRDNTAFYSWNKNRSEFTVRKRIILQKETLCWAAR